MANVIIRHPLNRAGPHFPCCCDIPLDIAVQLLTAFDLIYATTCLVGWVTVLGLDVFASRKLSVHNGTSDRDEFKPPNLGYTKVPDYVVKTTVGTTERLPFTLRTTTIPTPLYDYDLSDTVRLSETYSKIAIITSKSHDYVEKHCGREYIRNFLFTYQLARTREIFTEFLYVMITAEVINIILAFINLSVVCCFIEHKSSKGVFMLLYCFQWIPTLLNIHALVLSQSSRLCILEYAWAREGFRGQSALFCIVLWPLVIYKPYELLVMSCYIAEFLQLGFLQDESGVGGADRGAESHVHARYFKEFKELEAAKGRPVHEFRGVTEVKEEFLGLQPFQLDALRDDAGFPDRTPFAERKDLFARDTFHNPHERNVQLRSIRKE